jgi:hypothetical protein
MEPIMANMSNILIKDDAATPKEYTFLPIADNPPMWRADDTVTPLVGQPVLTTSVVKLKNGGYKVTAKLEVPVLETAGSAGTQEGYIAAPKAAFVTTCIFSMFIDKRSTTSDRANALKMIVGFLQGASATTAAGYLSQGAAGDAFKTADRPGVQLYTKLINPS